MIKYFLFSMLIFSVANAEIVKLDSFIQDDCDMQYRRLRVIDYCISLIDEQMIGNKEFDKIRDEYELIKFCLGYPIDKDHLDQIAEKHF